MFKNWEFLIAEMWGHLAIAVVLTLLMGWFLWGFGRSKISRAEIEGLEADLAKSRDLASAKDAELSHAREKQDQMRDRMAGIQEKLSAALSNQDELKEQATKAQTKLSDAIKVQNALKAKLNEARAQLADFEAKALLTAEAVPAVDGEDQRTSWDVLRDSSGKAVAKGAAAWKGLYDRVVR